MKKIKYSRQIIKDVINYFGGRQKTADELEVSLSSVDRWSYTDAPPAIQICLKIERKSGGKFKVSDIRPDLDLD